MNRYLEMGFSETSAEEAIARHQDDLHAGCHWLMTRTSMGSIPKRLKVDHQSQSRTYMGSSVRFQGSRYVVDAYESQHALVRLREENGHIGNWEHISDGRIEWISVQHRHPVVSVPLPAWKRHIGSIVFKLDSFTKTQQLQCTPSNVLSMVLNYGRPVGNTTQWSIWRAILSLTRDRDHVHEPTGRKPRRVNPVTIHQYRVEWMTYFHALSDLWKVSHEVFTELLFNEPLDTLLSHFPPKIHADLTLKIGLWKNAEDCMKKELSTWRKNCLPLVLLECESMTSDSVTFKVLFHDMTFVRPNNYEPGIHLQFQRLFKAVFNDKEPTLVHCPMNDSYLRNVLRNARQKKLTGSATPAPAFVSELFPYQRNCLQWLIHREQNNSTSSWGWSKRHHSDGFAFHTSVFGHMSLAAPNNTVHGGLLAQDVGMGKTVEMLALIATHKCTGPTLIVVPTTMLSVWMVEAAKHTPTLQVVKFHGSRRTKDMNILKAADIVVTTYRVVVNETSHHVPTIGSIRWGRIILDESHEMKTVSTATTRAVTRLYAPLRWCVSATPWPRGMVNVVSMLSFLGVTPFDEAPGHGPYSAGQLLIRQQSSVNSTLIHHALSEMTYWQKKRHVRLNLPPVTEQVIQCKNTHETIYKHLLEVLAAKIAEDSADASISHKTRLLHYTRWLRQAATHPALNRLSNFGVVCHDLQTMTSSTTVDTFLDSLGTTQYDESLRVIIDSWRNGQEKCSLCLDAMDRPTLTPCHHMFCFECIQSAYHHDTTKKCPLCRKQAGNHPLEELKLCEEDIIPVAEDENCYVADLHGQQVQIPRDIHDQIVISRQSQGSKFKTIVDMVRSKEEKIICFTQFHNTWKMLGEILTKEKISFVSIEGKMSPQQRQKAIDTFQNDPQIKIFIMTTRTASVGITLTAGSHVLFVEPCENIALRKQAIGRAWRIGQQNPITVTTLKTVGTIDYFQSKDVLTHICPQLNS